MLYGLAVGHRMHIVHRPPRFPSRLVKLAAPFQREGQLEDDADYQTAYHSARTVAVIGGRG
jgi:hypothetical protein